MNTCVFNLNFFISSVHTILIFYSQYSALITQTSRLLDKEWKLTKKNSIFNPNLLEGSFSFDEFRFSYVRLHVIKIKMVRSYTQSKLNLPFCTRQIEL